ncbi:MAG: ABC transporter substrate-binding protein [Deltaproteobacteria bacterium]|nr:ABC transporter substrate-binding protein [Deltaproteobacteria bacterium]
MTMIVGRRASGVGRFAGQSVVAAVVAASLLVGGAGATSTPLEQTRSVLERARAIAGNDTPHNQKLTDLSDLLKTFLDTDVMGKAALDQHWSKFSAAQQKEFLTLFRELFQRTYVQKLLLFEKPDFGYAGEQVDGDQARVDTKIITPRDEFAVAYSLRRQGGRWLATDIRIEDLSLTNNFRRQLDRILQKSGPEDLLNRMRKKYGPNGKGSEDEL